VRHETGLEIWERERAKWLSKDCISETTSSLVSNEKSAPNGPIHLNVDKVVDVLLCNRWRQAGNDSDRDSDTARGGGGTADDGKFPQPIPLPQIVDILVDLWEAEGLES